MLEHLINSEKRSPEFAFEYALIGFTTEISEAMEREGVSQAELARVLGKSRSFVSRALRGDGNLTLRTMTSLANALDLSLYCSLAPVTSLESWEKVSDQRIDPMPRIWAPQDRLDQETHVVESMAG